MRALAAAALALALATQARADGCVTCHEGLPGPLGAPVEGMKTDVHAKTGLSCAGCHGGDPADDGLTAMDVEKGFAGKLAPDRIPDLCGRCHADETFMRRFNPQLATDQLAQYRTSMHGRR